MAEGPNLRPMIAVVVVRDGQLPSGGEEAVAEAGGRALLAGTGTDAGTDTATHQAAMGLGGIATDVTVVELGPFHPAAWAAALAPLLTGEPHIVLPGSPDGRDLAPRLAALLHRPLYAGAISATPQGVDLARKGTTELHLVSPGPQFVATLMPGVRGVVADPAAAPPRVTPSPARVSHSLATDATVVEVLPPDPESIDLSEATRIIAAGAGIDHAERIGQLTTIGTSIGASTGATRVVTDRGWVPHARQIGTTGVVVDPQLYIAFGISGAVQHTSGLGNPDHTISVNTDAHCPMMKLADLAIVADANSTLDHLERLLTEGA